MNMLTTNQAAEYCGIPVSSFRNKVYRDKLIKPDKKENGRVYFSKKTLNYLIDVLAMAKEVDNRRKNKKSRILEFYGSELSIKEVCLKVFGYYNGRVYQLVKDVLTD